ncbi:hypothetical protein [Aquimarina rhabdastrellae]
MHLDKRIISLVFIAIIYINSYGQNQKAHELESFSIELSSFMSKLNVRVESYTQKSKALALKKELGQLQNELRKYLIIRDKLVDKLMDVGYDKYGKGVKPLAVKFIKELDKLSLQMDDIAAYVNSDLVAEVHHIAEIIYATGTSVDQMYLTELDKLLNDEAFDTRKFNTDGLMIYNQVSNAIDTITIIREKISTMYEIN